MEYKENIEKLCGKADDPSLGYAQITIDFFQDFEENYFSADRDVSKEPIERDELLSEAYQIGNIIEVMDTTKYQKDISLFKELDEELRSWVSDIEFRNGILGIPKHKG